VSPGDAWADFVALLPLLLLPELAAARAPPTLPCRRLPAAFTARRRERVQVRGATRTTAVHPTAVLLLLLPAARR